MSPNPNPHVTISSSAPTDIRISPPGICTRHPIIYPLAPRHLLTDFGAMLDIGRHAGFKNLGCDLLHVHAVPCRAYQLFTPCGVPTVLPCPLRYFFSSELCFAPRSCASILFTQATLPPTYAGIPISCTSIVAQQTCAHQQISSGTKRNVRNHDIPVIWDRLRDLGQAP